MNGEFERRHKRLNYMFFYSIGIMLLSFMLNPILGKDSIISLLIGLIGLGLFIYVLFARGTVNDDYKSDVIYDAKDQFYKLGLDHYYFSFNIGKTKAFKLDEETSNMIYVHRRSVIDKFEVTNIPFDKILDVTVSSNGSSLISVSKGGLVGGALVGGAVFGNVGSVVGAMSANKHSSELIHNIDLIITIDDLDSPIIKFEAFRSENGIDKNSDNYKNIMNNVDEWFGKFTVILKRNERRELQ